MCILLIKKRGSQNYALASLPYIRTSYLKTVYEEKKAKVVCSFCPYGLCSQAFHARCLLYPANAILYLGSDLNEAKLKEKARLFHDSFLTKVLITLAQYCASPYFK